MLIQVQISASNPNKTNKNEYLLHSCRTNNGDFPLRLLLDRFSLLERSNFYRSARETYDVPDVRALGADDGADGIVRNVEEDRFLLVVGSAERRLAHACWRRATLEHWGEVAGGGRIARGVDRPRAVHATPAVTLVAAGTGAAWLVADADRRHHRHRVQTGEHQTLGLQLHIGKLDLGVVVGFGLWRAKKQPKIVAVKR